MKTPSNPKLAVPQDVQMIFWLSGAVLLLACFLPWVAFKANRLVQGTFSGLTAGQMVLGVLCALGLPLAAKFLPKVLGFLISLCVVLGFWWLGWHTQQVLTGASDIARASASSGVWLWLLGAGIALYGGQYLTQHSKTLSLVLWLWLPVVLVLLFSGHLDDWSILRELRVQQERFIQELLQHLKLVFSGLGIALGLGFPLSVWVSRQPKWAALSLNIANGIQTIPSLALLGLLIAPLAALSTAVPFLRSLGITGIGTAPALTAMTLYALLPILQSGLVSLGGVSESAMDAAKGMGMTEKQRFWRVQLPLALPVWFSGVRQAAVLLVGVASVAQLIGAGGLGFFIFSGLQSGASDLIVLGAVPAALLAIGLDGVLAMVEKSLAGYLGQVGTS